MIFCNKKVAELQKEVVEVNEKIAALEDYLDIEYKEVSRKITVPVITLVGKEKVHKDVSVDGRFVSREDIPAHYEKREKKTKHLLGKLLGIPVFVDQKLEEKRAGLEDAIKAQKAKQKSDKLKKAWKLRKQKNGKNKR